MKKLLLIIGVVFLTAGCSYARPPKPGPNFVWVPKHLNKAGVVVKGHWKHEVKVEKHRVWVPPHVTPNGKHIPGHWIYK